MAKPESSLRNMVLCLLLISLVMSAALGVVYNVTKDAIGNASKKAEIQALQKVLPAFDNDPISDAVQVEGLTYYTGTREGRVTGYAIKTYSDKGFSGLIELMAGWLPDGTINNIVVLSQKETPGLGDKITTGWKDQFTGKKPGDFMMKVKKDGGDVDAISGATISSRAFCDAMQKACDGYIKNLYKAKGGNP